MAASIALRAAMFTLGGIATIDNIDILEVPKICNDISLGDRAQK